MSDGSIALLRDSQRSEKIKEYTDHLYIFLKDPTSENRNLLDEVAKASDRIKGGFNTRPTGFVGMREIVEKLKEGDRFLWKWLLGAVKDFPNNEHANFKKICPHKDIN
jgi:hypothetical protein